ACHKIAQSVAASILDRRLLFYVFRMLSNGNIQLMLDYYRALLASPNLDRTQLAGLAAGERLSEHRVIEDLMLYVYEKLNPANSFVMNLYNLGDPSVGVAGNALLRIRILQTIATRATYRDGTLGLRRSDLRGDLEAIGYRECAEKNLSRELKQMADYGLIQVMQFPEDPQTDDPIIVLQDAGHLYKDFLIYRYSYLQTVIPDCWLDYRASEPALDGDLHAIDDEIRNFIRFIGRCEKSEKRDLSEEGQKLLKTIAGPWSLAGALRSQFEIERSRQMGKTETK
ncbi:MAG: hypothetical protein FJY85_17425, partial [Deltaproteobacteria bacterium]|nr:hypothetical protein [Deltaproteobacteria bacterium]